MTEKTSRLKECLEFLPNRLPSRRLLEVYKPQLSWFLNQKQAYGTHHDIGHLTRVLIAQELITESLQEENPDINLDRESLRWAAVTHDLRKRREYELSLRRHGVNSAEWIRDIFSSEHPEIPDDTISNTSYINHFHGYRKKGIPKPHANELLILRDADTADMLRVLNIRTLRRLIPQQVREAIISRLIARMNFDISKKALLIIEQLGIISTSDPGYNIDPFNTVLDVAQTMGIITE